MLKMKVNLPDLFGHAATTKETSTGSRTKSAGIREMASNFHWLLKPLLQVCPGPVHTDSLMVLIAKMCEQTVYIDAAVATTLAMDLKWILNNLRKIRKIWKYCMRGKPGDWPEWAGGENFPHVLELVQMMEGFENDEAELAANWNLAAGVTDPTGDDISDLCGLWNMAPAEAPSRGSEKRLAEITTALEDKRQKVLSDLRDVQISIDDSDEDGAPAASASSGAREPASGHDAVALPDAAKTASIPHAAEDIAYDPRPEFVHDEGPLPAVDVRGQRALVKAAAKKPTADGPAAAKAKAKVTAKAKAATAAPKRQKKLYIRRTHKRGDAIAYALVDNIQDKQLVQLVNTYVPDAATKVQTWVDALNSGTLTVEQVIQEKDDIMKSLA
ncbi:unnamed protein product [Symbiodinium microadriaticum]|nr:unnamed protein product [Symbiodinium microadriaticum]